MLISEVIALVEALAPRQMAEDWDNVGLQVGNVSAETNGCLLSVDVTTEVVREARQCGAHLVIAHHPLVFTPLRAVTEQDPPGPVVLAAARVGVSIYAAHTNLDASLTHGTSAALADRLGLKRGPALIPRKTETDLSQGQGGQGVSPREGAVSMSQVGGLGMLTQTPGIELSAFAQYVGHRLGRRCVEVIGDEKRTVTSVALMPGSGGAALEAAARRADVLVTGELKYHEARQAKDLGLTVVVVGHYASERPVLDLLAHALKEAAGQRLQVAIGQVNTDPVWLRSC